MVSGSSELIRSADIAAHLLINAYPNRLWRRLLVDAMSVSKKYINVQSQNPLRCFVRRHSEGVVTLEVAAADIALVGVRDGLTIESVGLVATYCALLKANEEERYRPIVAMRSGSIFRLLARHSDSAAALRIVEVECEQTLF